MRIEPTLFDARTVKESLTVAPEGRNVPTQRASLHQQRDTGKASALFRAVVEVLYGCGREGRTLEELHARIAEQRPGTPLSSITQPLLDARLCGFAVKTNRSRMNGTQTRQVRIYVHRAHWIADDGDELVKDEAYNRRNVRRLVENGYPIYRGELPTAYRAWLEATERNEG